MANANDNSFLWLVGAGVAAYLFRAQLSNLFATASLIPAATPEVPSGGGGSGSGDGGGTSSTPTYQIQPAKAPTGSVYNPLPGVSPSTVNPIFVPLSPATPLATITPRPAAPGRLRQPTLSATLATPTAAAPLPGTSTSGLPAFRPVSASAATPATGGGVSYELDNLLSAGNTARASITSQITSALQAQGINPDTATKGQVFSAYYNQAASDAAAALGPDNGVAASDRQQAAAWALQGVPAKKRQMLRTRWVAA